MTLDPLAVADFLQRAGIVGLLAGILIGGARQIWVWGYQLREVQAERDRWQNLALKLMGQVERTTGVADRATGVADRAAELAQKSRGE